MAKQEKPTTRCGYVAIVGKPNVGKSTLLNHLVGQKISITSRKPQTTRHRIMGILTEDQVQVVFVDTPGIHLDEKRILNRYMNRAAGSSLQDVDLILVLVDGTSWNEDDALVIKKLASAGAPVSLVVNKVDKITEKESLLPHLQELAELYDFDQVFPLSALKGTNVDELKNYLFENIPHSEFIYPEDFVTDRSMRFLAAELVREKMMRQLGSELPYSTTVDIEEYEVKKGLVKISCVIFVERKGQKQIVIGKQGQRIKQIGQQAREELQELLQSKVYLQLWVKVKQGWADDERALKSMGFDEHLP